MNWVPALCVVLVEVLLLNRRSSASLAEYPRDVIKTLYVTNGGPRGYWQAPEFCPTGTYASSFRIKLEKSMYAAGDDTSLNGVRFTCRRPGSLDFYGSIDSEPGPWGYWSKPYECLRSSGHESFIIKFALKVEPRRGNFRDDSAANNIKFQCRPMESRREYLIEGVGGPWGTYGEWSGSCPLRSAICGLQTKVASPRGPGDDTALNDVRFFCCNDRLVYRSCAASVSNKDAEEQSND